MTEQAEQAGGIPAGALITLSGHRPRVAPGAYIAPGARLIGRVTVGAESSVWYNAVLRADDESVTVGRGTSVQDGVVIHADPGFPCTIGDNVTIGHGAIIHGAVIEDETLIGMGATVLNGARIGRGSIVGANALVPEGRVIPPNSLVLGVPGKVVRETGEAEHRMIANSAASYRRRAARYRAEARQEPAGG